MLLAIDLGVRMGVAVYDRERGITRYASHNFGSVSRLKRAARSIICEVDPLEHVFLEGDANLARHWRRVAEPRGARCHIVSAERWREALLLPRERRSGTDAKRHAQALARRAIQEGDAKRPTGPLRHDAAEAILIAIYGATVVGWRDEETT